MSPTIMTLGYQQRSIAEFIALAAEAGVTVVIDVRETAWSHKPGFSKAAFAAALHAASIEYVHADFAGNPKWLRQTASSHAECLAWYGWYVNEFEEVIDAFDALVTRVLSNGGRPALTCFERHPGDCHRSILAERWAARLPTRRVLHLGAGGCKRLVPHEGGRLE